jgi:hypothetical protein
MEQRPRRLWLGGWARLSSGTGTETPLSTSRQSVSVPTAIPRNFTDKGLATVFVGYGGVTDRHCGLVVRVPGYTTEMYCFL